ncbi:nitric oxide reductase transcriptional regulator NorR [Orrella marina]|uniref:Nitric oxide reductase transcriptional regulator NorR n=1 Tax=Orrella marina TaxID=2163011 RepID=A0A2R4XN66_9BURK|nr:nitric oxide reductase transcriptional regulator NorR [Orrella marina]AWB35235.1 nitric oxide reductase transcriptional regulator NorR [Orrella marina]
MRTELSLILDLITDLPLSMRAQRLVRTLRERFSCDAVGLLRSEGDALIPVALDGLASEAMGRRFVLGQHPRLAKIMSAREPVRFVPGDPTPDPYDGLLDQRWGEPLPVHDCLGVSLYVEGRPWGALTLDALPDRTFTTRDITALSAYAQIAAASMRVSRLEEDYRSLKLLRGMQSDAMASVPHDAQIVGQSAVMRALLSELDVASDSDLPVLLLGETGVGKELFALRIHRHSPRADKPMIHVNCAALPESLAESELFGHLKGAFSGAGADRAGRIEAADEGTLFLDEVGELPLSIQAKLLRTLQNGEVQRLGEDRPRRVNVRIVAATNRNLTENIKSGRFRADLYHRLSVYPVHVPPLRERGGDVLLLAGRFLELNRARLGLHSLRLSQATQQALTSYAWPGNIRELEHAISRAALRAASRKTSRDVIVTIEPEMLGLDPDVIGQPGYQGKGLGDEDVNADTGRRASQDRLNPGMQVMGLRHATDQFQRECIQQALERHGGNWSAAARALDLDASNLHKLARRLGVQSPA